MLINAAALVRTAKCNAIFEEEAAKCSSFTEMCLAPEGVKVAYMKHVLRGDAVWPDLDANVRVDVKYE